MTSLYDVLGVSPSATQEEIKRAYWARAKLLHPDRHATEPPDVQQAAKAQFELVNAAYRVLSDPAARAAYDRQLERGDHMDPWAVHDDAEFDSADPTDWLARAAIVGVSLVASDNIDREVLQVIASQLFGSMCARLEASGEVGDFMAVGLAYDAAAATYRHALQGPRGHAGSEIFAACCWAACTVLWDQMPAAARAGRAMPPSQPLALQGEPGPDGRLVCRFCEKAPAAWMSFHGLQGRLLWYYHSSVSGPLCRDCGRAVGRELQTTTLNQGWWGIFSGLATPFVLLTNASNLAKAGRLTGPFGLGSSLDPGKPVLRRRLIGLVAAIIVFGLLLLNSQTDERNTARTPPRRGSIAFELWDVDTAAQATAAANAAYRSPGRGTSSSQVIAIGFSPVCPRYRAGPRNQNARSSACTRANSKMLRPSRS